MQAVVLITTLICAYFHNSQQISKHFFLVVIPIKQSHIGPRLKDIIEKHENIDSEELSKIVQWHVIHLFAVYVPPDAEKKAAADK